jgi:signal transduction histidine kinase/ligand-binding sensor domain-containing protein
MKRSLVIILLLLCCFQSRAQQPRQLSFDHLNEQTGLPENEVRNMIQDSEGYIWATTQNGLIRYDGYKIKTYKLGIKNKETTPTYIMVNVFQDKLHNVWACSMDDGLFRYDRKSDSFISFANPKRRREEAFNYAQIDSSNNIWSFIAPNGDNIEVFERFNISNHSFERYYINDKYAGHLPFRRLNTYDIGATRQLLLGTENGVYAYQAKTNTFIPYLASSDSAKQISVTALYTQPSAPNILWLGASGIKTRNAAVIRLDTRTGALTKFNHQAGNPFSLRNDSAQVFYEDKLHRLWIGTMNGLSLYDAAGNRFINYIPKDTLSKAQKNKIDRIVEASDGKLWLSSGVGLLCFDPSSGQFYRYAYDAKDPSSLLENLVNTMMFDQTSTLWLGLRHGGIDRVNKLASAFRYLHLERNKFTTGKIHACAKAINGDWLIAAEHGLYRYQKKDDNLQLIKKAQAGANGYKTIYQSPDGFIYYRANGLGIYDPATGKSEHYSYSPTDSTSLSYNNVVQVLKDHTGITWIATFGGGMCSYNPATKKFKRYPFINNNGHQTVQGKLDDDQALMIFEDHAGTVWVGTNNGGLNHYDRSSDTFISSYRPQDGTSCVQAITEDNKGRLWIGTYQSGLFLVDHRTGLPIKQITEKQGLLIDRISNIVPNGKYLWVLTARGLSRVDTQDFSIRNFPSNNNWDEVARAACRYVGNGTFFIDNNILVIDGFSDLFTVELNGIVNDPDPPVVHIESVLYTDPAAAIEKIFTARRFGLNELDLPYNQNRITLNYVGLQYNNPLGNRYAYKLDGYDQKWIQTGTERKVTYTNLSPGTYIFHVIACNNDGVWNYKGDSLTIVIASPWWWRWWAWIIYTLLFASAVYAIVAYRSRQLKKKNVELEIKVSQRTMQLSEANRELSEQREEIAAQRDNLETTLHELNATQSQLVQREKMASLGELTAGIAHEIQNPLNFVNNFSEVSTELVDELDEELNNGDIKEAKTIAQDVKRNLEKIRHHGRRADGIVKAMLQHSQTSTGQKEITDINKLADEYLKLAYHGLRAKDKNFNADLVTRFDEKLPPVNIAAQDVGRVLLNLFNNAFYAVSQKAKATGNEFKPTVEVSSTRENGSVIIKVKDNGTGIPDSVKNKIMQPFFTTKPTGEGTGLGLSLSYDIVVKGHGGNIMVDTREYEGSEFTIILPLKAS